MSEVLIMAGVAGVAAVAFVSTNLDNLFLLMGLLAGSKLPTRSVALGYASCVFLVLAVAAAGSFAASYAVDAWLRYLGLVPLGMGLWRLRGLARSDTSAADTVGGPARAAGAASVFGVMLAGSGDALAVFASLMGESAGPLVVVIFATALGLSAVWAMLARWVVDHPALAPRLRSVDRYGVPVLLVAIGLYILLDTATDTI